ncbi:DUF2157 domain-containing protein [Rhizobium sp. TRM95111]|uniref:DUF2157 domain-containing protein n=1 Tax=Rhizobium alarense TaxID=2846851 RepID=UPI001F360E0E|nr:DUF2157 domain-containing protein [Rhizobium alarense]MCF3642109.1 DUF2157 domain-containing protein [Rhizobium alarense]
MYRGRLERDLRHWAGLGLIDVSTGERLLAEYDSRESAFSLGRILMMMAALLCAAAVLLLVASNWEAIARPVRLGGILLLIWGGYGGAAFLTVRGAPRVAAALLVAGTLSFGGAIAMVGQMYHLSGDAVQAALVWLGGATLVAVLFRSAAVTAVAGFLAFLVAGTAFSEGGRHEDMLLWLMPLMAVGIVALVRYADAGRVRHLAYLLLVGWALFLYAEYEWPETAAAIAAAGGLFYLAAALPQSPAHAFARGAGSAPAFYGYLLLLAGLVTLHAEADGTSGRLLMGILTLAVAVVGIALSGRDNGGVRYLGYVAFAGETLYLAAETIGSIIGTSGFFLVSGLVVAGVAWLVIRLERRFKAGDAATPKGA